MDEFYGPVRNAENSIARELRLTLHLLMLSALAAAGAMVLASILLARRITGPIRRLSSAARLAGKGELARAIPVESDDEVGELATILNGMMKDLADYVKNLKETMSLKERMEGELSAAHNIQQSILPHTYPLFPEITEFDVHAVMVPAREVGGDFYDIFFVEPRRVAFVIGDVSGKGVPAALFMAITRTLIRLLAMDRAEVSEILRRASHFLSLENEAQMFVTVLYGEYDLNTGKTFLANAGHCRPLLIHGSSPETVPLPANIPLGVGIPHQYPSVALELNRDDMLLLYTDGVTEAQSPRGQFYGLTALLDAVRAADGARTPKQLCGTVQKSLEQFGHGVELADDFTLLALQAKPL